MSLRTSWNFRGTCTESEEKQKIKRFGKTEQNIQKCSFTHVQNQYCGPRRRAKSKQTLCMTRIIQVAILGQLNWEKVAIYVFLATPRVSWWWKNLKLFLTVWESPKWPATGFCLTINSLNCTIIHLLHCRKLSCMLLLKISKAVVFYLWILLYKCNFFATSTNNVVLAVLLLWSFCCILRCVSLKRTTVWLVSCFKFAMYTWKRLTKRIYPIRLGPVKVILVFMTNMSSWATGWTSAHTHLLLPIIFILWMTTDRSWMLFLPNNGRL